MPLATVPFGRLIVFPPFAIRLPPVKFARRQLRCNSARKLTGIRGIPLGMLAEESALPDVRVLSSRREKVAS